MIRSAAVVPVKPPVSSVKRRRVIASDDEEELAPALPPPVAREQLTAVFDETAPDSDGRTLPQPSSLSLAPDVSKEDVERDPGLRRQIYSLDINLQVVQRRRYLFGIGTLSACSSSACAGCVRYSPV